MMTPQVPLDTLDLTLFLAVFTGLCLLALVCTWLADIWCWWHDLSDDWPGGEYAGYDGDAGDENMQMTVDANSRSVGCNIPLDKR